MQLVSLCDYESIVFIDEVHSDEKIIVSGILAVEKQKSTSVTISMEGMSMDLLGHNGNVLDVVFMLMKITEAKSV